jgi:indolepyruvate ferredoxin oxidoreductase alpha subunit
LTIGATGDDFVPIDIAKVCESIGAKVAISDPFDLDKTREILTGYLEAPPALKVLVLKQKCALSPEKKGKKQFLMKVEEDLCLGDNCGCDRLCTRIFRCPALIWDRTKKKAVIDDVICAGCGVCYSICPQKAITKTEAKQK